MKPWILDLICHKIISWYTTMLLEIVRPSCYHQISKEILKFILKTLMQICICGTVNGSGFGVADRRRQFYHISISNNTTIQYHWGEFFPHCSANRMYFQLEIKVGIFKEDFSFFFNHSLPVLHMTFKHRLCFTWLYSMHNLSPEVGLKGDFSNIFLYTYMYIWWKDLL